MADENFITRLTEVRDRAQSDIDLFTQFNVSVVVGYGQDDGRLLSHLKGTVASCDEILQRVAAHRTATIA